MKILNFGSLNVDHVYSVETIARPGETITSSAYRMFAGGKGANQSVALARAGANVRHAGKVGPESAWLKEKMAGERVNVDFVEVSADTPGGHAIIQVDRSGQNSIVLFGGANQQITDAEVDRALSACDPGDLLLLQNEINATGELISRGRAAGLTVCFNPAPMTDAVRSFPLESVDVLILNAHEGEALSGRTAPDEIVAALGTRFPEMLVILTLGEAGVICRQGGAVTTVDAHAVNAVDTTAAGDTFIGYFLAGMLGKMPLQEAVALGCRGAAVSVTRHGAMDSIPTRTEVEALQ